MAYGGLDEGWWRDRDTFAAELEAHGSLNQLVAEHGGVGFGYTSARKFRERHGLALPKKQPTLPSPTKAAHGDAPGVTLHGDTATVVSDPAQDLADLNQLLRDRGLSPDDWDVERVTVNEWQTYGGKDEADEHIIVTLRQLKAFLRKRVDLSWVFPAVEVTQRYIPVKEKQPARQSFLLFVAGDQQAPYFDEPLHGALLKWLSEVQPEEGVLCGDTVDLPGISRHMDNPLWAAPVQECLDVGYRLLSDYRDAAPTMRIRKLRGNHDWRLESELLTRAERMFGIRPAEIPGNGTEVHALSLRRLLHLDKLGIELAGLEGEHWKLGQVDIVPGLVVRHAPPGKQTRRVKASVIAGHTHRQELSMQTEWDDGEPEVRTVMQVGTLARIRGGLGYAVDPDWQQGFGTAQIFSDGAVAYDLAFWRDGKLTWRGETWK